MNKYLDEIGYKPFWENPEEDGPKFEKEREEYGFDQRETWELDETFAAWAYARLRMLMDKATFIDWDSEESMIDIPTADDRWKIDYIFTMKVTLKDAIDLMLELFEFFLLNKYDIEKEDLAFKHLYYAAAIWGVVLPALWW